MHNFTQVVESLTNKKNNDIDFDLISSTLINKFSTENLLSITTKVLVLTKDMIIYLNYPFPSEINPFKAEIQFNITLTPQFPIDPPSVKCKTNFIYPTIFDNRELLESILTHKWSYKKYNNILIPLEEIITQIPTFLKRIFENIQNRTLVYYGKIIENKEFLINDFIENNQIQFFNVMHYTSTHDKVQRYIILTDIYFLLFHPLETEKSKGILIMKEDLRDIKDCSGRRLHKTKKKDSMIITFENGTVLDILFVNKPLQNFVDCYEKRIKWMNNRYDVFQYEDYSEESGGYTYNSKDLDSEEKLIELIKYKEDIYNSKEEKSIFLIKDLIHLYERIIEILSAKDNEDFVGYLDKMKKLLNDEVRAVKKKEEEEKQMKINNDIQYTNLKSSDEHKQQAKKDFQEKIKKFSG